MHILLSAELGICCGNEDSCGNENRESQKKNYVPWGKIGKHTFFVEN